MLKLYNTLPRAKEELKPIQKEWVGLYTCGPTVYDFAHIGNLRTYIFEDILQRTLEYNGHAVRRVMNITDVGHLTSDADTGEDKLDRAAQAQKKTVQELAAHYTEVFLQDIEKLNIKRPQNLAPATDFIPQQIDLIKILFEKGFAYDTPAAIYFDVSKFPDYGKLSGQSLEEKNVGAREEVVVDKGKRNPADFVLWFKLVDKFEHHLLHWPSPWGEGFPGWHLECSAISRHFLGQPFDIHTGGVDHIGTHHTNEIAQSEAAFGVPLANVWMHGEFLLVDGKKMSKSAGTFITIADMEQKGYDPIIFRYLVLGAHYRTQLNFTWEALEAAKNGLNKLYQEIYYLALVAENASLKGADGDAATLENYQRWFMEAINDDLNTARALALLPDVINAQDISAPQKLSLLTKFDEIFGLKFQTPVEATSKSSELPPEMIAQYQQFRSSKQFDKSDDLRREIEALGYSVRDTESGSYVVKKFF